MSRILIGRPFTDHYSFLVVAHKKFVPNLSFDLYKRLFKHTKVGSIDEIEVVVNQSSVCKYSTGFLP